MLSVSLRVMKNMNIESFQQIDLLSNTVVIVKALVSLGHFRNRCVKQLKYLEPNLLICLKSVPKHHICCLSFRFVGANKLVWPLIKEKLLLYVQNYKVYGNIVNDVSF